MNNEPVIATLHGSDTIKCAEFELKMTKKRHGLVDEFARLLIEHGVDPSRRLKVLRNDTPVFDRDRSLEAWATVRLIESDTFGFQKRKYQKFNGIK